MRFCSQSKDDQALKHTLPCQTYFNVYLPDITHHSDKMGMCLLHFFHAYSIIWHEHMTE